MYSHKAILLFVVFFGAFLETYALKCQHSIYQECITFQTQPVNINSNVSLNLTNTNTVISHWEVLDVPCDAVNDFEYVCGVWDYKGSSSLEGCTDARIRIAGCAAKATDFSDLQLNGAAIIRLKRVVAGNFMPVNDDFANKIGGLKDEVEVTIKACNKDNCNQDIKDKDGSSSLKSCTFLVISVLLARFVLRR